jgi:UDP-N-acetylglucosamine 3-dehydrogenase
VTTIERTSSAPLRAAVIGVGAMGINHARLYAEMEDVTLVGVADPDPEARARASRRHHTRGYADHRALLEAERPDLVSLAAPTGEHYHIASELIARGVHLLIEKPIALTVAQGQALIAQARSCGVKLGVGHVERFNPAVTALKERLDRGELGRIFQIGVRRISGFPPRVKDVGVVLDLATHDLDVMRHLVGGEVTRVSAEISRHLDRLQEDMLCGLLRFDNDVIGLLNVNWLSPTKIRELTVNGECGMFVADYLTQDLFFYENGYEDGNWESLQMFRGVAEGRMIRYPIVRREPLRIELESFVRFVRDGEPFPVSGEDGLQALILAQHLVDAGKAGESLCLGPAGDPVGSVPA